MILKIEIFKKHYQKASNKEADDSIMCHMKYCIDAMLEYAESESKIVLEAKVLEWYRQVRDEDFARHFGILTSDKGNI